MMSWFFLLSSMQKQTRLKPQQLYCLTFIWVIIIVQVKYNTVIYILIPAVYANQMNWISIVFLLSLSWGQLGVQNRVQGFFDMPTSWAKPKPHPPIRHLQRWAGHMVTWLPWRWWTASRKPGWQQLWFKSTHIWISQHQNEPTQILWILIHIIFIAF